MLAALQLINADAVTEMGTVGDQMRGGAQE
jgi:hypothetical protein